MYIIHTSIGYISRVTAKGDYQVTQNYNDAKRWKTREGAEKAEQRIRNTHSNTLSSATIEIMEMEEKIALFSQKKFLQRKGTPLCCDPSSETYWSM